jgi:Tfp pilus assembly protein PilX
MLSRVHSRARDDGMAMVLVIVSMTVLTLVASTALSYALKTQRGARQNQDTNTALAAAQAGVEDYISHLNRNDDYGRTWDCTNAAMEGPAAVGNTCGWTSATKPKWLPVAGTKDSEFHYDIDPSKIDQNGTIRVTSTGRSKGVTRTLDVAVGRGGSTDFLYYTTYEHADPANRMVYPSQPSSSWCSGVDANGAEVKKIYWWSGRSQANANCSEIQFIDRDTLDGRVHVNDTPLIGGATNFKQGLETSDPGCKQAVAGNASTYANCQRGSGTPVYGVAPVWAGELYLQDNSSQFATFPGCQYTGPTRIVLNGDGTMNVWSKWSTGAIPECGGTAVTTSAGARNVAVPDGKVVYVGSGPASAARQCTAGEIGDGLPLAGDATMTLNDQFCNMGNLYIEGTLKGRLSVAASNSVVITGDLLLKNGVDGSDMLGVVAGNSIQVFHPWVTTTTGSGPCVSWDWTKSQSVGLVTPTLPAGSPSPAAGTRYGWQEGSFDNAQNPTTWTPGQWVTKVTSTQQYGAGTYGGYGGYGGGGYGGGNGGYSGSWSSSSWQTKADTDRWIPGTWQYVGGQFTWSAGSWGTTSDQTKYYQGEQWVRGACNGYQYNTTTTGEAAGWPHRTGGRTSDIQIYASIQALQHSFFVQNYNKGTPQGNLSVWGSIAQKWRGIVGTTGNSCNPVCGYYKDYRYDKRLKYSAPPYFPQWSGAQWGARYTGEVSARYR